MPQKTTLKRNEYRCAIELNQNGKYCVRLNATFSRKNWQLGVFFLAGTFDRSIKKLEESLQYLQRNEERLWFWSVDRSDDPNLTEEMLCETGLRLDRRKQFPRRASSVLVSPERPVPAFQIAPLRRGLAECVASLRSAVASD